MEYLALEIFDLPTAEVKNPTTSQFATLEDDASITITDTSEVFASGDVWSYSFTLNVRANAHIFGTAGDLHGSRLHDQIDHRRARLWVEGIAIYLGYLKLDDEAEVDADGNVDVSFESGQKTFDEMIEGTSATEVSVGDVPIGIALNRKRTVRTISPAYFFTLNGLAAYAENDSRLKPVIEQNFSVNLTVGTGEFCYTPYAQRWPKFVKSHGKVYNSAHAEQDIDYTNVQSHYDSSHPFCNLNICYPFKTITETGEEKSGRGYTLRMAHGKPTTHGGDGQTRYNNAPNFYLLYFIDRLFKDLKIKITENQCMDVEDLRRVFMLNYGCYYEEIENDGTYFDSADHLTPGDKLERYDQYFMKIIDESDDDNAVKYLLGVNGACGCMNMDPDEGPDKQASKVLLRDIELTINGERVDVGSTAECKANAKTRRDLSHTIELQLDLSYDSQEVAAGGYSAYLAYATGENYPHVDISEIVDAMKAMFGVRLLFNGDYSTVRIILLRNIFRNQDVQNISCDIMDQDELIENKIRGFRMTYGQGKDDTSYYYKGFADLLPRKAKTWKDTSDKHDYSQWFLQAEYDYIKQAVTAMNKICYVTPANGNAWGIKVDEDESVLFPSLFEYAGFMDAEDGDCSMLEEEGKTVEEISIGATPVIMNDTGTVFASLFSGDLKAPTPLNIKFFGDDGVFDPQKWLAVTTPIATFARISNNGYAELSQSGTVDGINYSIKAKVDAYTGEGFAMRMEDNYAISNGGTPFDSADPGLCFGVMRGSGSDAYISEYDDPDDDENNAWEEVPGSGAVSHPDTCDSYGNLFDYDGSVPGPGKLDGRFSLKLRGEKLNPYYDQTLPNVVTTKDQAGRAMKSIYISANCDLLNRPKVPNATMRTAGWDCPGDGYATVFSQGYGVQYGDGMMHEILWTPIRPDGTVLTPAQLQTYVNRFNGESASLIIAYDTDHLILDMDTTEYRAQTLNGLQAIYYADTGENIESVEIGNLRYLSISNPNLRQRGLADQFYKEYSFWVRNARICRRTVHMTLADLLKIDKTKRVQIADITGFIRKIQYTVDKKKGLGMVEFEIMYI